jgi:dihydroorotase
MMLRSFRNLSGVRETLLSRGALRPEVDSVLHRNALFIATIVAVSAAAAASAAAIAPSVKPVITDMARPSAYSYLILALLAILAISLTATMYLLRRSSKSQPIA